MSANIQEFVKNDIPESIARSLVSYQDQRAHAFILHGNIHDYTTPASPARLESYLSAVFAKRDIVAFYNPASGITFANAGMENTFRELLNLDGGDPDPVLQAAGIESGGSAPLPASAAAALALLERLLVLPESVCKSVVILSHMETVIPSADFGMMQPEDRLNLVRLTRWGAMPAMIDAGNPVYILVDMLEDLHPSVRAASAKWEAFEIPLPAAAAREAYISALLKTDLFTDVKMEPGVTPKSLANATAGLSLVSVEDVFLQAAGDEGIIRLDWVRELKRQIVEAEFAGLVEFVDPIFGFEAVGGLEHVKEFMYKSIINPINAGNKNRVPMGVLFTGPAGTGKSIVAEATAKESKINMMILRIGGNIASKFQGEGERNLKRVLSAAKTFSPVICFIDEIDQVISRGGGDSGGAQDSRMFQMILEFMSDTKHRGEIVFIAATNRPDLMDAALRRPGRFDKKVPFLIPNAGERESVFEVMTRRYGVQVESIPADAVKNTQGWTGAEIEAVTIKAYELIEDKIVSDPGAALIEATLRISPSTADIEFMSDLALQECNDLDLLPPEYRDRARDKKALEAKIEKTAEGKRGGRREI